MNLLLLFCALKGAFDMMVSHAGTSNIDRVHVLNDPAARDAGIARSEQQVQAMHRAIEEVKVGRCRWTLSDPL